MALQEVNHLANGFLALCVERVLGIGIARRQSGEEVGHGKLDVYVSTV